MMVQIEIKNATGPALDWLVARALHPGRSAEWITTFVNAGVAEGHKPFAPSTDPAQGHPLIEEHVPTLIKRDGVWSAECYSASPSWFCYCLQGPTALIASMRAIATAGKNGATATIPEELLT